MASLDVLDYQVALDAALAERQPDGRPLLAPALRRQAVRDARRVLDAMAFRFAILDERPLPEDLDYVRALEAMKPPARAAPVLARRAPAYQRVRRRRLVTSFGSLFLFVALVAGIAYLATLEESEVLATVVEAPAVDVTYSVNRTFLVTEDMNRLRVQGEVHMPQGTPGTIEVFLVDPSGQPRLYESYFVGSNVYLRENVYDPEPGEWTLLVDYSDARGATRVEVLGIRPTR